MKQTTVNIDLNPIQTAMIFVLTFMLTCSFGVALSKTVPNKVECAYFRFLKWTYNYGGIDCQMLLNSRFNNE